MTKIFEATNHILIKTGYADPIAHCHTAAHLIISMDGQMHVTAGSNEFLCRGVMIPTGIPHQIDTYGKTALVFLYDSTTGTAREISAIQCISDAICDTITRSFAALEQTGATDGYAEFKRCTLQLLGMHTQGSCVTDERIREAMHRIRTAAPSAISCREIAASVFLSQSRFSHLFKQQTGITFAAYLVYQRIMLVYAALFQGRSITEAAVDAGFSSAAHFADTNRRIFGLPATHITKDLIFRKVE